MSAMLNAMAVHSTTPTADDIIQLAQFSLLFGRVPRATLHEDGKRVETDTDHTVMLSLVACGLAESHYPKLDIGLVSQFALVHDLVETYAGDTPTLRISTEQKQDKKAREHAAMERIAQEFGKSFPFIPRMISRYETQAEPEARFVRAVDKIIPKATHILNKGATLRTQKISVTEARQTYQTQGEDMQRYASDFPEILVLREELVARMLRLVH